MHRMDLCAFRLAVGGKFVRGNYSGIIGLCYFQGIAKMVSVAVCDEYVIHLHLLGLDIS